LKSTDDLENLSRALEQLEHQAQLLNSEAITSNEQISRIEDQLTEVNSRVQTQIKKATAVTQSGNIF
jgi:predicted  nucleic acid-binding Zn-ribbon protein